MSALSRLQLLKLCQLLEVPDCDCPLLLACPCGEACVGEAALGCPHCQGLCDCPPLAGQEPCHHARAATRHRLAVGRWARLLLDAEPAEYAERATPAAASRVLSRPARIAVMARRHRQGLGLYHPCDLWRPENRDRVRLVRATRHLRNGADDPSEPELLTVE